MLGATAALGTEDVAVEDALGRVLAEEVRTAGDVPPFDNSAMDGFAVTAGEAGRTLRIVGEARAGAPSARPVGPEQAVRVSTGAAVPVGTEAVVPVEQAEEVDGMLRPTAAAAPGAHVRRAGEDVPAGTVVLGTGTRLGAAQLGVAAGAGRATVRCHLVPRVAVLVTGDELRPPGAALEPGQIHESNGLTLGALAEQAGARVVRRTYVPDDALATRDAVQGALEEADVVVVSGGVSVGPHDHVKGALGALGVTERFWGVALRPGKPTWFGTREATLVFGLPGNPVSAMVTFVLFARPALLAQQGASPHARRTGARLAEAVERLPGRDHAMRVRLSPEERPPGGPPPTARSARPPSAASGTPWAIPTGPQGSHQLTSMLHADGLALVPAGEGELPTGTEVTVELL